jgi:protein-export membrane protein SecD
VRRYARTLILIAILVITAGVVLGIQKFSIAGFERGEDTVLGLSLGLDLQGGIHLVYRAIGETAPTTDDMEGLKRIIERRANSSGLGEPIIQILGEDRILVQLPGVSDPGRAKDLIGETALLEFKHRRLSVPRDLDEFTDGDIVSIIAGRFPTEDEQTADPEGTPEAEATVATPEAEAEATAEVSTPQPEPTAEAVPEGPPVLIFEFTELGAAKFTTVLDRLTATLTGTGDHGRSTLPSRLDISVEGLETLRYTEILSIAIQRIGESTSFGMALPDVDEETDVDALIASTQAQLGDSPQVRFTEIQGTADEDIGLTGDDLLRAFASQHSASGIPVVNLEFKDRGTRIFGELTEEIVGTNESIAIFLDDEELISPVVQAVITTGTATISGGFTLERARDIALLLESGRLPVPIELIQERDIDAILGADSLNKSAIAGLVGMGLILLFMVLYYRVPGVVAALSLLIYATLLLAIFKLMPVTLTLSGVAAAILSIGMAVDANILIFERMKDELRTGRTLLSAVNIGFNRAWPAIRDGNVSTLITCAILFWFSDQLGTTIVQGFAATLAIGVLVSMFSAITVSRTLLRVLATTRLSRHVGVFVPSGGSELPQLQTAASAANRS